MKKNSKKNIIKKGKKEKHDNLDDDRKEQLKKYEK